MCLLKYFIFSYPPSRNKVKKRRWVPPHHQSTCNASRNRQKVERKCLNGNECPYTRLPLPTLCAAYSIKFYFPLICNHEIDTWWCSRDVDILSRLWASKKLRTECRNTRLFPLILLCAGYSGKLKKNNHKINLRPLFSDLWINNNL